jgi:hypothetical protein
LEIFQSRSGRHGGEREGKLNGLKVQLAEEEEGKRLIIARPESRSSESLVCQAVGCEAFQQVRIGAWRCCSSLNAAG